MRSVSSESYFALNAGYVESGVKRIQRVTLCQERTLTKLKAFVNGSLSSCTNSVSKSSASTFPTRVMRGSGGGAEAISARIRDMSCWALFHAFCQDAARESGWAEDMGSRGHGAGRGRRDRDVLDVHSRALSTRSLWAPLESSSSRFLRVVSLISYLLRLCVLTLPFSPCSRHTRNLVVSSVRGFANDGGSNSATHPGHPRQGGCHQRYSYSRSSGLQGTSSYP